MGGGDGWWGGVGRATMGGGAGVWVRAVREDGGSPAIYCVGVCRRFKLGLRFRGGGLEGVRGVGGRGLSTEYVRYGAAQGLGVAKTSFQGPFLRGGGGILLRGLKRCNAHKVCDLQKTNARSV